MLELKLVPDAEAYKAEYYKFMMNGLLTQLTRIEKGKVIEESHMRNRALIARWCFEKGQKAKVVEIKKRDGKTYVVVNDYEALRSLFGELLAEIQRIKSTGDIQAAKKLVETYAIQVDPELHAEILERFKKLDLAPYKGFVNPFYTAVYDNNGHIKDVKIDYSEGYAAQHLRYSKQYSFLPTSN
jgi:dipeptidyl-peptidase III